MQGVRLVAEAAKAGGVRRVVLVSSAFVSPHNYWSPIRLILNAVKYRLMDAKFEVRERVPRRAVRRAAPRHAVRSMLTLLPPRRASKHCAAPAPPTPSSAPAAWVTAPAPTLRG